MRRDPATIEKIFRYPVKGLSAEPLEGATLTAGQTVPGDRLYAIENGPTGFDPAAPAYFPKQRFLMLLRNERLAGFRSSYDDRSHVLTIRQGETVVAAGDLQSADGRAAVEQFFAREFARELRGPPKILTGGGHSFSDVARKVVSIINLASIAAIEDMVGTAVDPLRFRANLYLSGWPAWHEFSLLNQTLAAGAVRLRVVKTITRCAAVNVDPGTGARDLAIPVALQRHAGHDECGIYTEVTAGGTLRRGDTLQVEQPNLV